MEVGASNLEKERPEDRQICFETRIALESLVDRLYTDSDNRVFVILNKMLDRIHEDGEA